MKDLLVSVPHHSGVVPFEVLVAMLGDAAFDPDAADARRAAMVREGDPYTDQLFALPGARFVTATVSRFVVDLNRDRDDRSANGVVKRTDFAERPLYPPGGEPSDADVEARLRRFYDPYHAALDAEIARARPRLVVDAHAMTGAGPALGPDAGAPRPAAALITGGDRDGEPTDAPVSLPPGIARALAAALEAALAARLPLGVDGTPSGVTINDPFVRGGIQHRLGADPAGPRVPTVGIEINRLLFETDDGAPRPDCIAAIRAAVGEALEAVRSDLPAAG